MSIKKSLILIGHGSKLPYSKEFLISISDKLKKRNIFEGDIYIGLMEFNTPTIRDALKQAIDSGSKKIIVIPVFLALGTHTTKDIPKLLGLSYDQLKNENIKSHDSHIHSHHGHTHCHEHIHEENIIIPNDVEIIYKNPLGSHDKIVDIIEEKLLLE